jgi:hypothetical protein
VFRVVNGEASPVIGRSDVSWAADDGMGGVIYYAEPGLVEHVPLGATTPVTIATNATPRFVTRIDGKPTLEITQIQQGECDDADSQHAALIDLATGQHRLYAPCIPLQSWGIHPQSIGGDLSMAVDGGGWPEEKPVWARLVFRRSELPDSMTALTGWDEEALRLLGELELDVPANPWSQPCPWCTLDARLSSDGTTLALAELVPSPANLGAADWAEVDALDLSEQWRRWEELRRTADIRLRVVDLDTGDSRYSALRPGPGSLLDYDGRYLVYRFEGPGHHSTFPLDTHLIDTATGEEIPINWGTPDPGQRGFISLDLPD